MSIRKLSGGKGRQARKADNLTTVCYRDSFNSRLHLRDAIDNVEVGFSKKKSISGDITSCKLLNINLRFGTIFCPHLQARRITEARKQMAVRGSILRSFQKYLCGTLGYHSGAEKQKTVIFSATYMLRILCIYFDPKCISHEALRDYL
jgi:hypothetical protein